MQRGVIVLPAKDYYHDTVKRALIKDGWEINREQVLFIIADRHIWIDMEASKTSEGQKILVEVKGFQGPSQVDELMDAVGKYTVYRAVINETGGQAIPLYLTIPDEAYQRILSERIGVIARQQAQIKLLVFDPGREEIRVWID
jgi:hypothetical protein